MITWATARTKSMLSKPSNQLNPQRFPPDDHPAELARGPSGAVEYGNEIDELTAIPGEWNGQDILVPQEMKRRRIVPGPTKSRPKWEHRASPSFRTPAQQA